MPIDACRGNTTSQTSLDQCVVEGKDRQLMTASECHEARVNDASTAGSDQFALRINGVSKTFGATKALDAVGFDVRRGHIHGLLVETARASPR